jgi:hypothetical protein
MPPDVADSQTITLKQVIGLASIGARLYEYDDEEPEANSLSDCERDAWAHLFAPIWRSLPDQWRRKVRIRLDHWPAEFAAALADAERREEARDAA